MHVSERVDKFHVHIALVVVEGYEHLVVAVVGIFVAVGHRVVLLAVCTHLAH